MKKSQDAVKQTIVLNRDDFDGFLDLNSSDLNQVMKVLNEIMEK